MTIEPINASDDPFPNPFPRQPGAVVLTFTAEVPTDADRYIQRVYTLFDQYSADNITRSGYILTIYPRAVND